MKPDPSPETHGLSRRQWMKLAASAAATAALAPKEAMGALSPGARTAPLVPVPRLFAADGSCPAEWTGHNPRLADYHRAEGYPAYDPHPRYLGELRGSWDQIGRQYGERAGDLIRMVYEGWYREIVAGSGKPGGRSLPTCGSRRPTTRRWCPRRSR